MKVKKTYYYKTSSKGRAGCRSESIYWKEALAYSKAEIRQRFKWSNTRVEAIITKEEMDAILAENPETKVLRLDF